MRRGYASNTSVEQKTVKKRDLQVSVQIKSYKQTLKGKCKAQKGVYIEAWCPFCKHFKTGKSRVYLSVHEYIFSKM